MASQRADFLSIGELSRRAGVAVDTIRYYEKLGIIEKPARTGGGHRAYGGDAVKTLGFIRICRSLGFPLADITAILKLLADGFRCGDVRAIALRHLEAVRRKRAELFTGTGVVSIVASQAGDANWNAAPNETNTFNVNKATASVTLTNLNQVYDGTARVAGYETVPSPLSVWLTYDGHAWAPTNVGSYVVTGTVSDANYSGSAVDTLVIGKAGQTIAFPVIGTQIATNVVGLAATAGSGLPVSFATVAGPGVLASGTSLSFMGGGTVSVVARQEGDANWNAAPEATNSFDVLGLYTVTVASLYGTASPTTGAHVYVQGTAVTNRMLTTPLVVGLTQQVCAGWAIAGLSPVSGTTTTFVMTVTNSAALSWLWHTNYWLDTAASNGTVDVAAGWRAADGNVTITATPASYYRFTNWTGDVTGDTTASNPLTLLMSAAKAATANFTAILATNSTPEPWLAGYGWTNNFNQAATDDPDGDGQLTWQEYVAGTDPTNPASGLWVARIGICGTNFYLDIGTNDLGQWYTQQVLIVVGRVLSWPAVPGRLYDVEQAASERAPVWQAVPGGTNLPGLLGSMSFTNLATGWTNRYGFYRIRVRLP